MKFLIFQLYLEHSRSLRISLNGNLKGSLRSSGSLSKRRLFSLPENLYSLHFYKAEAFIETPPALCSAAGVRQY